jgi:hypothetical protein
VPKAGVAAREIGALEREAVMSPNDNTAAVDVRNRSRKRAISSPKGLDSRILTASEDRQRVMRNDT